MHEWGFLNVGGERRWTSERQASRFLERRGPRARYERKGLARRPVLGALPCAARKGLSSPHA